MLEIEFKFPLDPAAIPALRDRLAAAGFAAGDRTHEKTVMWDNPAGLMQTTDGRIRLRRSGERVTLSYKKPLPSAPGKPKKEIEHETAVGDEKTIAAILEKMDFAPTTSYEKYRTTFRKNAVVATIDEYPFATFFEIEGPEDAITEVARELGFDPVGSLRRPCDTLFQEWRAERGLPPADHMLFENFDK